MNFLYDKRKLKYGTLHHFEISFGHKKWNCPSSSRVSAYKVTVCDLMSIIYLQLTNMASGVDLLMYFNTSCVECSDMGPPPDTILGIPPPPLPAFLQRAPFINNTSTCSVLCDWTAGPGVEYVELPRHGTAQSFSLSDDKAVCKNWMLYATMDKTDRIFKFSKLRVGLMFRGHCDVVVNGSYFHVKSSCEKHILFSALCTGTSAHARTHARTHTYKVWNQAMMQIIHQWSIIINNVCSLVTLFVLLSCCHW